MIRVEQFSKVYGDRLAVDGLSFEVESGEVLGLVGPNGAGKTTTLRSLSGILHPTRGQLSIAGHDITTDTLAAKQLLAIVSDDPSLFDSLTVWEHFEFVARIYDVEGWEAEAEALLEEFELEERREALADELSRGMKQKVAVTCALLHRPKVLLLDEPLTGLDPKGIRTLFRAVQRRASEGATVVISSHLLGQIEGVCTRFLILHQGKRLHYGTPEEIRAEMPEMNSEASLEEIFFHAIEGVAEGPAARGRPE